MHSYTIRWQYGSQTSQCDVDFHDLEYRLLVQEQLTALQAFSPALQPPSIGQFVASWLTYRFCATVRLTIADVNVEADNI